MRLVLIGPPGVGKGTVAECLERNLHFKHLSAGDLLRAEALKKTAQGKKIKEMIDQGQLVPGKIIYALLEKALKKTKDALIDGFPRSLEQAQGFKPQIDGAILLTAPEKEIIKRLSGRRICSKCQEGYHIIYIKPKTAGICDKCGGKLIHRPDDQPNVIKKRFKVYQKETLPVIKYYTQKGILHEVNANHAPAEVCIIVTKWVKGLK